MGIRLDQAAATRLVESTGQTSGLTVPRRPASAPAANLQPLVLAAPTSGPVELDLQAAVEEINRNLRDLQTSLEFIRDEASGRSAVIVRNAEGDVIRQVPPEAVLRAYVQVRRIVGLLLDETS